MTRKSASGRWLARTIPWPMRTCHTSLRLRRAPSPRTASFTGTLRQPSGERPWRRSTWSISCWVGGRLPSSPGGKKRTPTARCSPGWRWRPGARWRSKKARGVWTIRPAPSPVCSMQPPRCSMHPRPASAQVRTSRLGPAGSATAPTPHPPRPGWATRRSKTARGSLGLRTMGSNLRRGASSVQGGPCPRRIQVRARGRIRAPAHGVSLGLAIARDFRYLAPAACPGGGTGRRARFRF